MPCPLATEMTRWLRGGHAERSFSRLANWLSKTSDLFGSPCSTNRISIVSTDFMMQVFNRIKHIWTLHSLRWCKVVCFIQPSSVEIPLLVTTSDGDELEMMKDTAIIWPWDFFAYLWKNGKFLQWIADDPDQAADRNIEYWNHCEGLEFFDQLQLSPDQYGSCVPVFFHTDGVKIYKNQKAWVYSMSSACRKGPSMSTKMVFILVRDAMVVKSKTHDAIGRLAGYIMDTLMTGRFPTRDSEGNPFPPGTQSAERAGQYFAGGYCMAFAGFKGDWEARVIVHKLKRSYRSTFICEHCMASYKEDFTFADFRPTARSQAIRFSHNEFLMLNLMDDQSAWTSVKGWTKDRNLEETVSRFQPVLFPTHNQLCLIESLVVFSFKHPECKVHLSKVGSIPK